MTGDNAKELLEQYKEIHSLSQKEKCKVTLVINPEKNQIAVKKFITGNNSDIFHKLKETANIHLPKIYLLVEEEGCITLIEEYIEGVTLQDLLVSSEIIEETKLTDIMEQLCDALTHLHNLPKPIIHRDIKPSNIILSSSGVLKLIDFDASREYKSDASKDTVSLGTIEYAAPEQFGYSQTDVRSDIYAVGMLTQDFIKRAEAEGYSYRHIADLKRIINKCTMFDPNQRYQGVNELSEAIKGIKHTKNLKGYLLLSLFILAIVISIPIFIIGFSHRGKVINNREAANEGDIANPSGAYQENRSEDTLSGVSEDNFDDASAEALGDASAELLEGVSEEVQKDVPPEELETAPVNVNQTPEISPEESNPDNIHTSQLNSDDEIVIDSEEGKEEGEEKNISTEKPVNQDGGIIENKSGQGQIHDVSSDTVKTDETKKNDEQPEATKTPSPTEIPLPTELPSGDNASNNIGAVIANPMIDYYKNKKYREDLKIYIRYNGANEVKYLSMINYGHIDSSNYSVDGNIITVKKEYLDTLPSNFYNLTIGFDAGHPAGMQFEVHAESEDSPFGYCRLSHYNRDFYTTAPEDFIFLVYNINGTKIKTLWNDTDKIDTTYYQIEENGYVVTLDKSFLIKKEVGSILKLKFEFENGEKRECNIRVLKQAIKQPSLRVAENTFIKSSPEDVTLRIIWNDAEDLTAIYTETVQTPELSTKDYQLQGDIFTLKKEVLQNLSAGRYRWGLIFDTGFGNTLTINVLD